MITPTKEEILAMSDKDYKDYFVKNVLVNVDFIADCVGFKRNIDDMLMLASLLNAYGGKQELGKPYGETLSEALKI